MPAASVHDQLRGELLLLHLVDERLALRQELLREIPRDAAVADLARVHPDACAEHEQIEDLLARADLLGRQRVPLRRTPIGSARLDRAGRELIRRGNGRRRGNHGPRRGSG